MILQQQKYKQHQNQILLNISILIMNILHKQLLQIFISLNLFFHAIENQFFQILIHMLNFKSVTQLFS